MGLHQWQDTHTHAGLPGEGNDEIQTQNTLQSAKLTAPTHRNLVQNQETIHRRRSGIPPAIQR